MGNYAFWGNKLWKLLLVSLSAFLLSSSIIIGEAQARENPSSFEETSEYIIKFKSPIRTKGTSQLQRQDLDVYSYDPNRNRLLIQLPANPDQNLLEDLSADPSIEYIEPNLRMRKATEWVQDPRFEEQWGLHAIHAPETWKKNGGTTQVTVAVLDTGVDYTHPDLANRVDARNGYNYIDGHADPMDDDGHGTHVAGIIAAEMNKIGIAGVSGKANVKILPFKVLDHQGNGTMYDVSLAIMDAVDKGADVINLSLTGERGKEKPKMLQEAIDYARDHDVAVIAAAGNDGGRVERYVPASMPGVIAVSAVGEELELAKFSNYGSGIGFAAPGEEILSTYLRGRYVYASGTSQAAPFVSGTVALIKAAEPELRIREIEERLRRTATDLGRKGPDEQYGYGLVNAYLALQEEVTSAELRSLSVNPGRLSLRPGSTMPLQATAIYRDQTQWDVTDQVTWQVLDESVVTIERGKVTALAFGQTQIIASYADKRFTIPIEVKVSRLEVSEDRFILRPDEAVPIDVIATYGDRTQEVLAPSDVRWRSLDEEVATVKNGLVLARGVGNTTITASFGDRSIKIKVKVKISRLVAVPGEVESQPDEQIPVRLYAYYGESREVVTDEADWQTSDPEVAVVEDGRIVVTGPGWATIRAAYRGEYFLIRVDARLRRLETPDLQLRLKAEDKYIPELFALYQNGSRVEVSEKGTWHSSDEQVAVVDEQGVITAIKEGTGFITASYGGKSVRIQVRVDIP